MPFYALNENWKKELYVTDLKDLKRFPRILMEAELHPTQGDRFQPTGFADLGAAQYTRPDGTDMLLVESAQSVANRLEKTCLEGDGPDIEPDLRGLPYVAATLSGAENTVRTSSLVEAHRIGSPYFLLNKKFSGQITEEMKYNPKRPLDWRPIYAALFKYDPNSLLHGVFLSLLEGGRIKAPRAITGFIEAEDVRKVISGGVKNSSVDPKGELQVAEAEAGERGVYSNVPYNRIEYTARRIRAYFNIDVALIHGYGLPETAENLLLALSMLKVRRFLSAHLRLRTACDFSLVSDVAVTAPSGFALPTEEILLKEVQAGIKACKTLFAEPPITELDTKVKVVTKKDADDQAVGTVA
jgi:CRISPR-associated protein Csb1